MDTPLSWSRAQIVEVKPSVDCGRFPVKRVLGEPLCLEASVVTDGHDLLRVEACFQSPRGVLQTIPLKAIPGLDRYRGRLIPDELGLWHYWVRAWIDRFATWQELFQRRLQGDPQELPGELKAGAALLREVAQGDPELIQRAQALEEGRLEVALDPETLRRYQALDPRQGLAESAPLPLRVDRERALYGSWYEFFPRSAGNSPRGATLDEAKLCLEHIARMGFDVVYLPPIHPIGTTHRKGKDGALEVLPGDPGSPWAIGSPEGGHTAVHPELGGLPAFDRFVAHAQELGLEVALDLAFQCSPDHPWVHEHPEWFYHRPDGSLRYAENPPKKYQDIYPLNFESPAWRELWLALREVVRFWIQRGIRIFRVDNPHTKPLAFWEWLIGSLQEEYPDLIFLSEAFTRPELMYALSKVGFSQSYTYFAWRNSKDELESYLQELARVADFFRPNFWPTTPDILPPFLQWGGRAAFELRLVLAATLSASYGLYGPAYELMVHEAHPEREEYRNNEKYEIRLWDWDHPQSLVPLITRINHIRKAHRALQRNELRFHPVDNPQILAYSKGSGEELLLIIANLDVHHPQSGWVELPLAELGLPEREPFMVHDLIREERYFWQGSRNYVLLDPQIFPAHFFWIHRRIRREQDFDYYL